MKKFFPIILLFFCLNPAAQVPPAIQWQKCYGGTAGEATGLVGEDFIPTSDGGYIACVTTVSTNADITGNHGMADIWVIKFDVTGNIQWKKCYGGTGVDGTGSILQTPDGGYMFTGRTASNDGDVTGNHGMEDVWLVKITATGVLQWQKCFGGSNTDWGETLTAGSDGNYLVGGRTDSQDGDVTNWHGGSDDDIWLIKVDINGNVLWQRCYGGTASDHITHMIATSDGGYFFTGLSESDDGDISCINPIGSGWNVKLGNAGNIQWQNCMPVGLIGNPLQTNDGGYIIAGDNNISSMDIYIVKTGANGAMQWERNFGGTDNDYPTDIQVTADGGYIIAAQTRSADGDICRNKGTDDIWVLKLDNAGNKEWQRTVGGTGIDGAARIVITTDGGYLLCGTTSSNDVDISGNHSSSNDITLVKLNFPGIPELPSVSITADTTVICPGETIHFIATPVDEGTAPIYQWQVNGLNVADNNPAIDLRIPGDGDVVRCLLTSNSNCVTDPNAISNSIVITVDGSLKPADFLQVDTAVCKYGKIELKSTGAYDNYLWNTGATTASIIIKQPGKYWLDVSTNGCSGSDTILVTQKLCLKGFFMPTAFTPNNDGTNDWLKPIVEGKLLQYHLTIMNRWGQVIFQTTDANNGWDGKYKGIPQDENAYLYACTYQLSGETVKSIKGTIVLIR
ncbi:MAG: gliding motility-associated C-terminal domain-containing protein [Ferruginibacter sp.]